MPATVQTIFSELQTASRLSELRILSGSESSGNVGIGTNTPGASLHVDPHDEGRILLGNSMSNSLEISISKQSAVAEVQSNLAVRTVSLGGAWRTRHANSSRRRDSLR